MSTRKARDLTKGDRLLIGGKVWDVVKAKTKGKKVALTVSGNGSVFASQVKAGAEYELAKKAKGSKLSLTGDHGQQTRWASETESAKREKALRPHAQPGVEPAGVGWDQSADKAEKRVRRVLDAELLAVKPEGSSEYFVPMIGPDTIAAHLLTFHDLTIGKVGIELSLADYQEAQRVHDAEHIAYKEGTGALTIPHWHARVRPAQ